MRELELKFTDADGQRMHLRMHTDGSAVLTWPNGHWFHFAKNQFDLFMDKLGEATRNNEAVTINMSDWLH